MLFILVNKHDIKAYVPKNCCNSNNKVIILLALVKFSIAAIIKHMNLRFWVYFCNELVEVIQAILYQNLSYSELDKNNFKTM